jgi:hypothetical protein
MPRPFASFLVALLACVPGLGSARADDPPAPASLVFVASDLPDLARGFSVPREGQYTIKVWATGLPNWSFRPGGPVEGQAITLDPKADDSKPRWLTLGSVSLVPDRPATISIQKPEGEAAPAPVPSIVSLSTDPDFTPSKALDVLRGKVNSIEPTNDRRRTVVRSNQEGADFQPPESPRAWRDRAGAVREQLLVTLGLWPMPPRTELNPRVTGTLDRDGYAIDKVVLETFPGFFLAGNLYRPTAPGGRRPVVLCPHGHWQEGRVNVDVQSRCVRLAQLGCIVFMYDMVGYADSKPFGHAFANDRLRRWGLSLPGLQTWDSIRALDWLLSRPDVDPARVAITGESGGGTQTFLLTAIDDRIKVAAPVVMVSDSFQGGCVCENGPGLRIGTDNVEFAALAAPRPMKLVGATGDWTARTMTNALPSLQVVYAQAGATTHLEAEVFDFPHNYNQTSRNAVYAFLARWLLGNPDAASTREGTIKVEDPKDLYAFNADHPYPADAKTPAQLETELIGVVGRQLDKLAPGNHAASWEASRNLLGAALRVRVGLEVPVPRETSAKESRRATRDGLTIVHSVVGRKGEGDLIPVVRLTPEHPNGRLAVLFTPRGKADLTTPEGAPTPIVRALLDRGQSVVGFDPLLVGESQDPAAPASRRPSTVHYDCYNPSLAADRAQDLATVIAWARALADVREVNLVAQGPLALLARPELEGLSRTAIDLEGFDYGDGSSEVPPGLDLPGVLQFGGLKAAAALVAPAPLWISHAPETFDATWPTKAYALVDASPQLRLDRGTIDAQAIAKWIDLGE